MLPAQRLARFWYISLLISIIGIPLSYAKEDNTSPATQQTLTSWLGRRISSCHAVHAVSDRAAFFYCLANACSNTIQGKKELSWKWRLYQTKEVNTAQELSANDLGSHIRRAIEKHAKIDPDTFLWGAATSAHQVDGVCSPEHCSWARWEHEHLGTSLVHAIAGKACDHWNMFEQDIDLLKNELGMNTYRFSIEWSTVEPQEGMFDARALDHYAQVCKALMQRGIKPLIGLHHYTDPCWFMNKGGFAKEKNITYFVRFATHVIGYLQKEVFSSITNKHLTPQISTFNSPSGYAAKGYFTGTMPPGIQGDMQTMIEVLKNLLEAHVLTYQALKLVAPDIPVGILKNMYQMNTKSPYNPISQIKCEVSQQLTTDVIFSYFTTGIFNVYIPTKALIYHENIQAPYCLDFIGLNYYSNGYIETLGNEPVSPDPYEHTANPTYRLYPEGLYLAIKELSQSMAQPISKIQKRPIPIYITENGIAPIDDNDAVRTKFYQRYLYALGRALNEGYDVRGYITWSLLDNYEWGSYGKKYGLFRVNFESPLLERSLKTGSNYLKSTIQAFLT